MKKHSFIILILLSNYYHAICKDNNFEWITDDNTITNLSINFQNELKPDDPKIVKPQAPYLYKFIYKIGKYNNFFLVIIAHRETKDANYGDFHYVYSFNQETNIKQPVLDADGSKGYLVWTFIDTVSFEVSEIPDIVFKHYSCLECESSLLLSSFLFDNFTKNWKIRIWPENDACILIASDTQYGDDFWDYNCLFKLIDYTGDGYTDIISRIKESAQESKVVNDSTFIYWVNKGKNIKKYIMDKNELIKINRILCEGIIDNSLCK